MHIFYLFTIYFIELFSYTLCRIYLLTTWWNPTVCDRVPPLGASVCDSIFRINITSKLFISGAVAVSTSTVITHWFLSPGVELGRNYTVKCIFRGKERKDKEMKRVKQAEKKKGKNTERLLLLHDCTVSFIHPDLPNSVLISCTIPW